MSALLLTLFTAFASSPYGRPAPVCEAGEIRVSSVNNAWYDLYVDGVLRVESRNDGQQVVRGLSPGRHHVRVTHFIRGTWSDDVIEVGCGSVVVAEVHKGSGLSVLTHFSQTPPAPRPVAYGRGHGRRPGPPRPAAVCTLPELSVMPSDNVWYDVYVDGVKRIESRNFDGTQTIAGLAPGRHHIRVTSFVGELWSQGTVDLGCGDFVLGEVRNRSGLRYL